MSAAAATAAAAAQEEKGWRTAWLRGGGSLSEVTWIGRDALGWCSGLHLVFLDVPANRLRLPDLANDALAPGASCLAGHLRHKVFAFADKNSKPRIHVYAYPSMTKISECHRGTSYNYLSIVFSGDYLVSLGSLFGFRLSIWFWRTGEKLVGVHTHLHDAENFGQTLRVNYSTPLFIAQIGNKSGKLLTWETTLCASATLLNSTEIKLPHKALVKDVAWCPDSNDILGIVDRDGHVYISNSIGGNLKRIVLSQRCAVCIEIEPAAICWYRGGIILRTTFCQIRYYQKDANENWRKNWYAKVTSHPRVLTSHPLQSDRVFFITSEGYVVQMKFGNDLKEPAELVEKYFLGGRYKFVDFIRPWDDHIVAMDDSSSTELSIVHTDVGVQVSSIDIKLKGDVRSMLSHPEHPLVAVTSDRGEVAFVSLLDCREPKALGKYRMQAETLDLIRYSSSGRYLAVGQKSSGSCFLFDVSCDKKPISVVANLNVASKIVDLMAFDTANGLKLCVLQCLTSVPKFGYKLLLFHLPTGASEFKNALKAFCFSNFYESLHCIAGESAMFVGTPYLTKKITYFRITDWKSVSLIDVAFSGHQVRQAEIIVSNEWLITAGGDGLVFVKSLTDKKKKSKATCVITHHRSDSGVSKAIVNKIGNLIVALGADGSLVALKYRSVVKPADRLNDRYRHFCEFGRCEENDGIAKNRTNELSASLVQALSQPIQAFADSQDLLWLDWKEQRRIEEEAQHHAPERGAIASEFVALKKRLLELLDENESCSELKRLPISAFALDKLLRDRKIKAGKDEREEVRHELESGIVERNRVAGWLRDKYWDSQSVLARSIFGIADGREVTNYAMAKDASSDTRELCFEFARFERAVNAELTGQDGVYPWDSYTEAELRAEFERQSKLKKSTTSQAIQRIVEGEEEDEEARNAAEDLKVRNYRHLYEGMTTRRFIEPCAPYYSQLKICAFAQFTCDIHNVVKDTMGLRLYFNKQFADVQSIKEREMNLVRERVDRVLFVISELEFMFDEYVTSKLTYPEWHMKEKPESIVDVSDKEMKARPYITPSYQDLLDRQAAEEERARLARLADDFRERALQAMMDGVLEVRWEDIIKREPEKPECLATEKSVDDYTEEDQLAVKKYEQELSHLTKEREKYRKILKTDYVKINDALTESVDKFNSRLEEFHLLKIKIEAAIQQLNLRYVRHLAKHVRRLNELKEVESVKSKMQNKYQAIAKIDGDLETLKNTEQELLGPYENLLSKDKLMEKKLQSEFPSLGKNALVALTSQYKKRPKVTLKTTSPDEGIDLGRCVTSMDKLPYLTSESLDYLRHLDILDVRPATLPQSIDAVHWKNLVALRRLKIEHELKLRAAAMKIEAVASSISDLSGKQAELASSIESTIEDLKQRRAERIDADLNVELQLVLKMGQVEDEPLRGSLDRDLRHAIVVPRRDLARVNEAIATAGRSKIRTIQRNLKFARGIELEDWQHRCLKMRLEHRAVGLYYVRMANVTRETREYLERRRKGQTDDKTNQRLKGDADKKRRNLEKSVDEWQAKLNSVSEEVVRIERKNQKLDKTIVSLNVERCELEVKKDYEAEARHKDFKNKLVKIFAERSAIARKLLDNFEQLLKMREDLKHAVCKAGQPRKLTLNYPDFDV